MNTPSSSPSSHDSLSPSSDRHDSPQRNDSYRIQSPAPTAFLFGHPISHSLAPLMHHTLWNATQSDLAHDRMYKSTFGFTLLDSLDSQDCLTGLADLHCLGCSITMPHKLTLMDQVDELSQEAKVIGAINTIYVHEDSVGGARRLVGTNTDCVGIRDAFLRCFHATNTSLGGFIENVQGKTAVVIGAGGTARAAIYALWKFFEIRLIYLANRFEHEAEKVMRSMRQNGCSVEMRYIETVEAAKGLEPPVLVVGTVPDMLAKTEEEIRADEVVEDILRCNHTARDRWLLDMCYHPNPISSLMKRARKQGWHTVSGIEALKHQGIKQFELWTGRGVDETAVRELSRVIGDAVLHRRH